MGLAGYRELSLNMHLACSRAELGEGVDNIRAAVTSSTQVHPFVVVRRVDCMSKARCLGQRQH